MCVRVCVWSAGCVFGMWCAYVCLRCEDCGLCVCGTWCVGTEWVCGECHVLCVWCLCVCVCVSGGQGWVGRSRPVLSFWVCGTASSGMLMMGSFHPHPLLSVSLPCGPSAHLPIHRS